MTKSGRRCSASVSLKIAFLCQHNPVPACRTDIEIPVGEHQPDTLTVCALMYVVTGMVRVAVDQDGCSSPVEQLIDDGRIDIHHFRRFFLITLLGYQILIPLYIICWIVMPEARTAAEKLSMRGEAATVENIGRTVTDGFSHRESAQPAMDMPWWKKAGNVLLNILGGLVKTALVVLAVVCVPVLFAFCLALIPLLFAVVVIMISGAGTLVSLFPVIGEWIPSSPLVAMLMVLCVILVVGIPLFAILWMVFRTVLHWHPMPLGVKWTLLILWLISVVAGVSNLLFFVAEPLSIHDLMSA